jgi:hypothetical protein
MGEGETDHNRCVVQTAGGVVGVWSCAGEARFPYLTFCGMSVDLTHPGRLRFTRRVSAQFFTGVGALVSIALKVSFSGEAPSPGLACYCKCLLCVSGA